MTQQPRIRELIDEMDANPQLAEALKEKLLTRDLKDLPANFRDHRPVGEPASRTGNGQQQL